MKVIKSNNQFNVIDCELIKISTIYRYEEKELINYDLSIVWDCDEEQCYIVDNKTHLILSTHLSSLQCFEWLDRVGYELITLKRKYDKVRYEEEIKTWKELERS